MPLENSLSPSNLDKWNLFMQDCTAPQTFIDYGFYYLIAASLQRRVWFGDLVHKPIFPNIYVVMVGKPGLGKDLVIEPVENILREHKLENAIVNVRHAEAIKEAVVESLKQNQEEAYKGAVKSVTMEDLQMGAKGEDVAKRLETLQEKPLVIPLAANATTFEALVEAMAKSTRRIRRVVWNEKESKNDIIPYSHCSLCFCLGEISSLFRKKTEAVVNFLLEAYNCKNDYTYTTISRKETSIRKLCLNLLGGTTPGFMESVFDDSLLNEGFSSRAWFIFESESRFNRIFISCLNALQWQARADIVEHSRKLTCVCGPVFFTLNAQVWLKNWWEVEVGEQKSRQNRSPKLDDYYSRKQLHVIKMSMILHFSELDIQEPVDKTQPVCWDNQISTDTCKRALELLNKLEKKMHLALTFGGANPLYKVGQKIVRFLDKAGQEGVSYNTILAEFYENANTEELKQIVDMLIATSKVESFNKEHESIPGKILGVFYRIPADKQQGDEE